MERMHSTAGRPVQPQVTIRYTLNGQEYAMRVDKFPFLIGRDSASAQLVLPDATVSRAHGRLVCRNGAVLLENMSRTNPTTLNGQIMEGPVELSSGDQAYMGICKLVFHIRQPAQTARPERRAPVYPKEEYPEERPRPARRQTPEPRPVRQSPPEYLEREYPEEEPRPVRRAPERRAEAPRMTEEPPAPEPRPVRHERRTASQPEAPAREPRRTAQESGSERDKNMLILLTAAGLVIALILAGFTMFITIFS